MGEVELQADNKLILVHAVIICYGDAASHELSMQIAADMEYFWNEPAATVAIRTGLFAKDIYNLRFHISGRFDAGLTPQMVFDNTDPRNNYFRVEEYASGNISFVDGLNSNTGYFLLENLINNSSTAAHEFGHTLGLDHPHHLDIRGQGVPGIMYPRGTKVDPEFQYDPAVEAGLKGGTLNPYTRKVLQKDIDALHIPRLDFDENGLAILGGFSSVWHNKHLPGND